MREITFKKSILFPVMCLLAISTYGQLTITGEVRPRAEYRDGFKTLKVDGNDPAFFVEQRTRLGLHFVKDNIMFKLSLQDIRLWGGASQIYKADAALFNANEAWAGVKLSEGSTIKVGRQMLDYDNARILGNLAWAQQSRSHDLIKYEYQSLGNFKLHLGAAFNQENVNANAEPARLFSTFYSGVNNYKTMQFAWMNTKYESGALSLLLLSNGYQLADSSQNFLHTGGTHWKQKLGGISLLTEGYYQFGRDATDRKVDAYMLGLSVGFKIGESSINIGADHLSGTSSTDTKNKSFSPLFGTNHKFYGLMDYFYVGNGHGGVGLTDAYVKFNFKLSDKSNLLTHIHYFNSAVDLTNTDGSSASANLANELDLVYNLNVQKDINWKLGVSVMSPNDSMGLVKNGNPDDMTSWAWTMLTIKPTLFKSND